MERESWINRRSETNSVMVIVRARMEASCHIFTQEERGDTFPPTQRRTEKNASVDLGVVAGIFVTACYFLLSKQKNFSPENNQVRWGTECDPLKIHYLAPLPCLNKTHLCSGNNPRTSHDENSFIFSDPWWPPFNCLNAALPRERLKVLNIPQESSALSFSARKANSHDDWESPCECSD